MEDVTILGSVVITDMTCLDLLGVTVCQPCCVNLQRTELPTITWGLSSLATTGRSATAVGAGEAVAVSSLNM
jgi:hypothetical protein